MNARIVCSFEEAGNILCYICLKAQFNHEVIVNGACNMHYLNGTAVQKTELLKLSLYLHGFQRE